jgi:hypothetical protein
MCNISHNLIIDICNFLRNTQIKDCTDLNGLVSFSTNDNAWGYFYRNIETLVIHSNGHRVEVSLDPAEKKLIQSLLPEPVAIKPELTGLEIPEVEAA